MMQRASHGWRVHGTTASLVLALGTHSLDQAVMKLHHRCDITMQGNHSLNDQVGVCCLWHPASGFTSGDQVVLVHPVPLAGILTPTLASNPAASAARLLQSPALCSQVMHRSRSAAGEAQHP